MASVILTIVLTAQAAFAGYNLYLARDSINKLGKYEDTGKKLAKYSNIVQNQMDKTRATQASGALSVLLSLLSSLALIFFATKSMTGALLVAAINVGALGAARAHVGSFWKGKKKVPLPGMSENNEAIGDTLEVRLNMLYLIGSWLGVALLRLVV